MIESFKTSFALRNTYRTNSIIYSVRSLPLLRRKLKGTLYANRNLKQLATILSIQSEIGSIFIWKILYIILMVVVPLNYMEVSKAEGFLHLILFLTLIGGFLNTQMFIAGKDKYYAIFLMRMDAKKYTLSNYFYFLFKIAVGLTPVVLIAGLSYGVDIFACLLIPLLAVGIKCSIAPILMLSDSKKKVPARRKKLITAATYAVILLLLVSAYLPIFFGYALPQSVFYIVCTAVFIRAVFGVRYMLGYQLYKRAWKDAFAESSLMQSDKLNAGKLTQINYQKGLDVSQTSQKSGYSFFNDIFIKRHSRLLTKSAKWISLIMAAILIAALAGCALFPEIKKPINKLVMTSLPFFLFIMYFINRGKVVTQAMFMNCDHSMLTYRFYRQPKVVLNLFAARLKSVVKINLMPAVIIASGLPLLLLVTGGTNAPVNYLLLFVSIIAMSVFFSVHNMVLYYLLQPYNIDIEIKNPVYTMANSLTYVVCYVAVDKQIPTLIFGALISCFCILYVIIALILAYRLAPKTFKLRI